MAKQTKNPLDGLTQEQIKALIEKADITDKDEPVEIVIKGKNINRLMEALGLTKKVEYDPDDESDEDESDDGDEGPKAKESFADKFFRTK